MAGDWQREIGVPDAPPTFMGPGRRPRAPFAVPTGPNVDISAVDPLWRRVMPVGRAGQEVPDRDQEQHETLPFGGDRLGRDVLAKAIKGAQISVFVGVMAALVAT